MQRAYALVELLTTRCYGELVARTQADPAGSWGMMRFSKRVDPHVFAGDMRGLDENTVAYIADYILGALNNTLRRHVWGTQTATSRVFYKDFDRAYVASVVKKELLHFAQLDLTRGYKSVGQFPTSLPSRYVSML